MLIAIHIKSHLDRHKCKPISRNTQNPKKQSNLRPIVHLQINSPGASEGERAYSKKGSKWKAGGRGGGCNAAG